MFRDVKWYGVKTCVAEDITRTAVWRFRVEEAGSGDGVLALECNELQAESGVNAPADATRLYARTR